MKRLIVADSFYGGVDVKFDYDPTVIAYIKAEIPKSFRAYVPAEKTWRLDGGIDDLLAYARLLGFRVEDNRRGKARAPQFNATTDWATALFEAVGADRATAVYRALSKVLHPDAGGDHSLMVALTSAKSAIGGAR